MHKIVIATFVLLTSLFLTMHVDANDIECKNMGDRLIIPCKIIKYNDLPCSLKELMTQIGCNVNNDSNYNFGYSVDLNDDGKDEIAFCCNEAPHGPCYMKIFTNVAGQWKDIVPEMMPGYGDYSTPCLGFVVLKNTTNGFHDICSVDSIFKYMDGGYRSVNVKQGVSP